jgi:acetolactate synthase small subunit
MTRTLELTLTRGLHSLSRVVTICARRQLEVVGLSFSIEPSGLCHAELVLEGDPRLLVRAHAWLERPVEVLCVRAGSEARSVNGTACLPTTPTSRPFTSTAR